jgi:stage V sporulation protein SpoVS
VVSAKIPEFSILLSLVFACGFPRPADVGGEAGPGDANAPADASTSADAAADDAGRVDAPSIDAPDPPGTVLHVSPSGDDANDGLTKPVKTLKHAIGLAAANQEIRSIVLASGRYSTAGGETFPYAVPANVAISGPVGGGAILAGSKTEPGMMVDSGTLQDLELEDFTVAAIATGLARLANLHIRSSTTAVRAETAAKLTVENLDITGTAGACATGVVLNGAADLVASTLVTRNLGTAMNASDQSTGNVTKANITGIVACTQAVVAIATTRTFSLSESLLDTGFSGVIVGSPGSSTPTPATLTNVIVRNMDSSALDVGNAVGQMVGGELSHTRNTSFNSSDGGRWALTNVSIVNSNVGIFVQDASLSVRGCTISANGVGIALSIGAAAELGTLTELGGNVIKNSLLGLAIEGGVVGPTVRAVGNTWNPGQGADMQGKYSIGTVIPGPVDFVSGNNFDIQTSSLSIQL